MSRRDRDRPATPAEQAALERVVAAVNELLGAPPGQRQAAVVRVRRYLDRIRDPRSITNLPTSELLDAIRDRYPVHDGDQDHDDPAGRGPPAARRHPNPTNPDTTQPRERTP